MAKIFAPNEQYTGVSAGVTFVNGEGESKNRNVTKWFKDHGYYIGKRPEESNVTDNTEDTEENNSGE